MACPGGGTQTAGAAADSLCEKFKITVESSGLAHMKGLETQKNIKKDTWYLKPIVQKLWRDKEIKFAGFSAYKYIEYFDSKTKLYYPIVFFNIHKQFDTFKYIANQDIKWCEASHCYFYHPINCLFNVL